MAASEPQVVPHINMPNIFRSNALGPVFHPVVHVSLALQAGLKRAPELCTDPQDGGTSN
jgi:hypothetical protein